MCFLFYFQYTVPKVQKEFKPFENYDTFEEDEILISSRKVNLRLFTLNNDNFAVREMKKAYKKVSKSQSDQQ